MTRWAIGDEFICDGIRFRVVKGHKQPRGPGEDMRLEMWHPDRGGWYPVGMRLAGMLSDFHWQIENILYPPPQWRGGRMFADFLHMSMVDGWPAAVEVLERQKSLRRAA